MDISHPEMLIIGTSVDTHIDSVLSHVPVNIQYCRFDIDSFPKSTKLTFAFDQDSDSITISAAGTNYMLDRVKVVWFRRLGAPTLDYRIRDLGHRKFALGEVEAALFGLTQTLHGSKWVSSFESTRRATKVYQLAMAKRCGLIIPRTIITNDPAASRFFVQAPGRHVYKTLHSPSVEYETERTLIFTHLLGDADLNEFSERVSAAPCVFQDYIDKAYELRITYTGNKFWTIRVESQGVDAARIDWRAGIRDVTYAVDTLPADIENLLHRLMTTLDLSYGAIDMIVTKEGQYVFLEVNPHGAWLWLENATGAPISKSIADHLCNLCQRTSEGELR